MTHGPLIGIVGPMMSGKTTFAEILVADGFTRLALADPVKDGTVVMLNALMAWLAVRYEIGADAVDDVVDQTWWEPMDLFETMTWLETQPLLDRARAERDKAKLRKPFQVTGTEIGRQYIGPDTLWIDILLGRAATAGTPVVCDDVRFGNEATALLAAGFKIYRVARDEDARARDMRARYGSDAEVAAVMSHPSEAEALTLPISGVIRNTEGDGFASLRAAAAKIAAGEDPCG